MTQLGNDEHSASPIRLRVPWSTVADLIRERLTIGSELRDREIRSPGEFLQAREDVKNWTAINGEVLLAIVDSAVFAEEHLSGSSLVLTSTDSGVAFAMEWASRARAQTHELAQFVDLKLRNLRSIAERVERIAEVTTRLAEAQPRQPPGSDVFIVHGHDHSARDTVALFVERLGLNAIILEKEPDLGLTIIEKFERDAAKSAAAIVLLTPDDVGGPSGASSVQPRARQNVIFELGYFAARLGRGRVFALMRGSVEIPSDYGAVVYTRLDDEGIWKIKIAANLKASGIAIQLDRLL